MTLYLSEEDVEQLAGMPLALEAVEHAHREHAHGRAIDQARVRTRTPHSTLHMLQGALEGDGVLGYKAYTTSRAGSRFFVHLFDAADGQPIAVIAADYLGMLRTGAAGGIAAKWLARKNARQAAVFGAGWQARSQIEALCAVRDIERVRVCARNRERLIAFCAGMSRRVGREVVPANGPREALEGADIVVTITSSAQPVFDGAWLEPGMHVTAAGSNSLIRRELDERAVGRADVVCVDSRATALRESGDLLPLLEKGRLHEGRLIELGEIVAATKAGRKTPEAITLFESHGMAIQDLALAARILPLARGRGVGTELPF
ncbi:MAG: ornithine cyclodeaminase family protein [Rhodocyclaceae bacterium]